MSLGNQAHRKHIVNRLQPGENEQPVFSSARPNGHFSRSDLPYIALMTLVVSTAVVLRWSSLGSESLWVDEGYTIWVSRFSPGAIWHSLQTDTSSPLYYILLHYWAKRFGGSAFSVRELSAVFSTFSIPLFYFLARKILINKTAIILAMALYAVSFYQIWYAKEARCYGLLAFLSLASVYSLVRLLENRTVLHWCGLIFSVTASLYTHNMALFYLPALALFWFVYPAQREIRKRLVDALLLGLVVLVLYIPWIPTLLMQAKRVHANFWMARPNARDVLDSLGALSGFDPRTLSLDFYTVVRQQLHIPYLFFGYRTWYFGVLLIFVLCATGGLCADCPADRRKAAALLAYSSVPLFLVFTASRLSTPVYGDRVFIGSSALLPMMFCAPIAFQVGTRRRIFQLIGLAVLLGTTVSAFGYLRHRHKEDWRGATEYLLRLPERQRLLMVTPMLGEDLIRYYGPDFFKSNPQMEVAALPAFAPMEVVRDHIDQASGNVQEIDAVIQTGVGAFLLTYLAEHCASVEAVDLHGVEVRRCLMQSTSHNSGQ